MPNLNRVLLMGNAVRDPEVRAMPSGTLVCSTTLASNRRWTNKQGQAEEETLFIEVEAFGRTAEFMRDRVRKGTPIFVEGRLRLEEWTDKAGVSRSKIKAVIENLQLTSPRDASDADRPAPRDGRAAPSPRATPDY